MKYLVASDIHGSLGGAQLVRDAFRIQECDAVLCLGDILYHGPRNDLPADYAPKEVIPVMNSLRNKIIAVRGNCDSEVDQMVLEFPITADYQILFLKERRVIVSHGHIYSPDHHPKMEKGEIFLSGHTHIPTVNHADDIFLLNPGSVSLPKENHPKSYAVLDENAFTVYTEEHKEYMRVLF